MRVCGGCIALLVGLVAFPGFAALAVDGPALPDNPLRGRLLFESKHCNECHAIAGRSTREIGPRLEEGRFRGTFLDLGAALWNHVPGMSVGFEDTGLSWPKLSAEEVSELTAFLYFIDYLGRPGIAENGKQLFSQKGCAGCHGVGGRTGRAPDLSDLKRFASPLYIAQAIWNHGPAMLASMRRQGVPPPRFDEGELSDLSAYLRQIGQSGPQERALLAPGNPNHGRELFASKGCGACHGGNHGFEAGAPDLKVSDFHHSAESIAGSMWNHAGPMGAAMREAGLGWPSFSTSDLADLVAYIYFLPFADPMGDPERGARVFRDRACADCHGESVSDTKVAPNLAETHARGSSAELVAAMWNHAPLMRQAILGEGLPWPELTGRDLRDLRAFLSREAAPPSRSSREKSPE